MLSGQNLTQQTLFDIPADVIQSLAKTEKLLPACPADRRQLPNEVVRSALFCARNRNKQRPYYKKEKIAVIGGGEITYTGEELRQDDETVWMHLIHLARNIPLGDPVCFTPYEFLKGLKKTAAPANYTWLEGVLTRMQASAIQFTSGSKDEFLSASMIIKFAWKKQETTAFGGKWMVLLDESLRSLFCSTTHVNWEQRLSVSEGIASKLMGYWASHSKPYPVTIDTLQGLCRNEMDKRDFKKKLKLALEQLRNVKFLNDFEIKDNKVYVQRALRVP